MNHRRSRTPDAEPFDPVALTLAMWLGLIVGVTGLIRASQNAQATQASLRPPGAAQVADAVPVLAM